MRRRRATSPAAARTDDFHALPTIVINLPRDTSRLAAMHERLQNAHIKFERMPAVDGSILSDIELKKMVTPLGRMLLTRGTIGCFLSHRKSWAHCISRDRPLLILEDDAAPAADFKTSLLAAIAQLAETDPAWDVLLVGGLGCVHPQCRYRANLLHAMMGGGPRWPRSLSAILHVPLRPFGTHAYVITPRGAQKLLALCPRANFHVDVSAWGQRNLRLYLATGTSGQLLAKQAPTSASTIGGLVDRSWLPTFIIDAYTGAEFSWAFNSPILRLGPFVLTIGRSLSSTTVLAGFAVAFGSRPIGSLAVAWLGLQFALIQALKVQRWPSPARTCMWLVCCGAMCVALLAATIAQRQLPPAQPDRLPALLTMLLPRG